MKLADRLHNMRTLDAMRLDKRQRISQENAGYLRTNRIGLNKVYRELQDLSFKHTYPNRYQVLAKAVKAARGNRRELVGKILVSIEQRLAEARLPAIKGREKSLQYL